MSPNRRLSLMGSDDEPPEPVDPDFALICDYLSKALSMKEADAVERRLVDDGAFFEKVWPVVEVWRLPRYVRQRRERARRKAQGLVPPRHESPAAPPLAIAPPSPAAREGPVVARPAHARPPADEPFEYPLDTRRHFWSTLWKETRFMLKTAAVFTVVVGAAYNWYSFHNRPFRSIEYRPDRAAVADIRQPVVVETGPGDTKEIILAGGSRLLMRQNSRMTYAKVPGPFIHVASASFDGEMALELNREDRFLSINTSSGRALFTPGTYALKCEPGCAAMLVSVGVGTVQIRGERGSDDAITLHAGEKGRVPKNGSPERVTGGSGWPALEPGKPAEPAKPAKPAKAAD